LTLAGEYLTILSAHSAQPVMAARQRERCARRSGMGLLAAAMANEAESKTRKQRIDPKLDAAGWPRRSRPSAGAWRSEEKATAAGPADYALWLGDDIVGVVEAKKLTLGPQNVLTQAQRYARGLSQTRHSVDGFGCPFLYSTNGEIIWFQDVRHPLNRSRRIAVSTPVAPGTP
jgi:type I restriction enzyme R subunit